MTYEEAEKKAISMEWKINTCFEGEKCWCRIVVPVEDVLYKEYGHDGSDYEGKYELISAGAVNKHIAERIVEDHNLIIAQKELRKRVNGGSEHIPLSERIKQQEDGSSK